MAAFLTDLVTKHLTDKERQLSAPLIYQSDLAGEIIVPAGFITDLASVPRVPLAYLFFGHIGDKAAVVHDYLYAEKLLPRKQADQVFREALEVCGVSLIKRNMMYGAVRAAGGFHYG